MGHYQKSSLTRSGLAVVHSEASYGRASKKEITRQRLKRKLENTILWQVEEGDMNTTPRRQTRAQIRQMEELTTPPSALTQMAVTPPENTAERFLRRRLPKCSDFGIARHFLFRGQGFFFCNPCDTWGSLPADRDKRCSRVSA